MRLARPVLFVCLPLAAALWGAAAQAGTVTVSYSENTQFTDAGPTPWEREANLRKLSAYMQSLGARYLPADRNLSIEVLDVDLAGDVKPFRLRRPDVRVARGTADWPRITLRYSLTGPDGQVIRRGDDVVSDMNYLGHVAEARAYDSLPYEKRMLDQWFKTRFVSTGD